MGSDQRRQPSRRTSPINTSKTRAEVSGSRLPVGSSARSSRGRLASARAKATRCCSPPESSAGRWPTRCPSPTASSSSPRPLRGRRPPGPGRALWQRHVLECGELRQQVVELVDKADGVAPKPGARAGRRGLRCPARAAALSPRGRDVEQPGDVQERRLARPDGATSATTSPGASVRLAPSSTSPPPACPGRRPCPRLERQDLTHSAAPRPG